MLCSRDGKRFLPGDRIEASGTKIVHQHRHVYRKLLLVLDDVLHLQLTHALDFIEIYHEAFIVSVKRLNALSAEDSQMV